MDKNKFLSRICSFFVDSRVYFFANEYIFSFLVMEIIITRFRINIEHEGNNL